MMKTKLIRPVWQLASCSVAWAVIFTALPCSKTSGNDRLEPPVRLTTHDGQVIDAGAAGGHCGPTMSDVDGDGLVDLVVGDYSGKFRFYKNIGTNQQPRFDQLDYLQAGGAPAEVPIY